MNGQLFSRRNFIKTGSGLFATMGALGIVENDVFAKSTIPIGVQLYSVRKEC